MVVFILSNWNSKFKWNWSYFST